MPARPVTSRLLAATAALALTLAACAGGSSPDAQAPEEELAVAVASYDLAVGESRRLIAGVLTADAVPLAFGSVTFEVGPVGEQGAVTTRSTASAEFLPVLGLEPDGEGDQPRLLVGEPGRGVYQGLVDLDEPGTWAVQVTAELEDGTVRQGRGVFEVASEPQIVDVGDPAPATANPTIADVEAGEVRPVSLDSRAQGEDDEVPDAHLHDTVIAEVLDDGRPLVVLVATPVYCRTAFCGPLTDEMAELALSYDDRVDVVHLEVYEDFEASPGPAINAAAAEWISPAGVSGNEPWVFVVDGDGTIAARWDNVVDRDALVAAIDALL